MKKKKIISYTKERAILSDALPYETPIIFSNRYLYKFFSEHKIRFMPGVNKNPDSVYIDIKSGKLEGFREILGLLLSVEADDVGNQFKINPKENFKIPFRYKIAHKQNDFRELSIPHPKNQLELIKFYDDFKEQILYYSDKSSFSIRKPHSLAKYTFVNDSLHKQLSGDEDELIEDSSKEYESLKTFFSYSEYTNIYKFYEDYHYHRAEKKYNKLLKFDIARCFDSIYTHSICWALYGKEVIKDKIGLSQNTFGAKFDNLMQRMNYNETNGILIGPEVSRIFAELILQEIDKRVELEMRNQNLYHRRDYEVYRYVDDFFVFYNDEETSSKISLFYKSYLSEYKMSLSDSKTKLYEKPLITELTIAKERIVDLFEQKIFFRLEKCAEESLRATCFENNFLSQCNANHLITRFKIIIKESSVEYKDIMNFSLALLTRRVERAINLFDDYYRGVSEEAFKTDRSGVLFDKLKKDKIESSFVLFILDILDFSFFLYTVSPRVNSTIKLSSMISKVILFTKGQYRFKDPGKDIVKQVDRLKSSSKLLIFKKIVDDISLVLEKNRMTEVIQLETLYLLVILKELGKEYRLSVSQLIKYLKLVEEPNTERLNFSMEPNYFVIITVLFYCGNITAYENIKLALKKALIKKIEDVDVAKLKKKAEFVMLLLDLLVCPFLDNKFKRIILNKYDIADDHHDKLISYKRFQKYWFTKWDKFNLADELHAKIASEPYS